MRKEVSTCALRCSATLFLVSGSGARHNKKRVDFSTFWYLAVIYHLQVFLAQGWFWKGRASTDSFHHPFGTKHLLGVESQRQLLANLIKTSRSITVPLVDTVPTKSSQAKASPLTTSHHLTITLRKGMLSKERQWMSNPLKTIRPATLTQAKKVPR